MSSRPTDVQRVAQRVSVKTKKYNFKIYPHLVLNSLAN